MIDKRFHYVVDNDKDTIYDLDKKKVLDDMFKIEEELNHLHEENQQLKEENMDLILNNDKLAVICAENGLV